jgi:hypothetical protein
MMQRQKELLAQLLVPLIPKIRGGDDQDSAISFRPALRNDRTGFNAFAEPDLVASSAPLIEARRMQKGRRDLMRVQGDLGDGSGKLLGKSRARVQTRVCRSSSAENRHSRRARP